MCLFFRIFVRDIYKTEPYAERFGGMVLLFYKYDRKKMLLYAQKILRETGRTVAAEKHG